MADHKWMVDVLLDLETYAKNNELNSLLCLLGKARSKAAVEARVGPLDENRQNSFPSAQSLN